MLRNPNFHSPPVHGLPSPARHEGMMSEDTSSFCSLSSFSCPLFSHLFPFTPCLRILSPPLFTPLHSYLITSSALHITLCPNSSIAHHPYILLLMAVRRRLCSLKIAQLPLAAHNQAAF